MITKFNNFINEGNAIDYLKPKSEEELSKIKIDLISQIKKIVKLNSDRNIILDHIIASNYPITFWRNNKTERETIVNLNDNTVSYEISGEPFSYSIIDLKHKNYDKLYEDLDIETLGIIIQILKNENIHDVVLENFKDLLQGKLELPVNTIVKKIFYNEKI